jgi:hypothetical protein
VVWCPEQMDIWSDSGSECFALVLGWLGTGVGLWRKSASGRLGEGEVCSFTSLGILGREGKNHIPCAVASPDYNNVQSII